MNSAGDWNLSVERSRYYDAALIADFGEWFYEMVHTTISAEYDHPLQDSNIRLIFSVPPNTPANHWS